MSKIQIETTQQQKVSPPSLAELSSQQPVEIPQNVLRRLLQILMEIGLHKSECEQLFNQSYQQNLQQSKQLSGEIRYNNYWQAAVHLATAAGSVVAAVGAAQMGMDVPSAMSMATKCGEAGSSILRGKEQWKQGDQKNCRPQAF